MAGLGPKFEALVVLVESAEVEPTGSTYCPVDVGAKKAF